MSTTAESNIIKLSGILDTNDDALRQSIYDFLPGLVYLYEVDKQKLKYINKKVTETLGFSYDDLQAWDHDLAKLVFSDDSTLFQNELDKFHEYRENNDRRFSCRLNHKKGDYLHFEVTGKVLRRTEQGKAQTILFIAQDIDGRCVR